MPRSSIVAELVLVDRRIPLVFFRERDVIHHADCTSQATQSLRHASLKCSGADEIPKETVAPNGVMKVVNKEGGAGYLPKARVSISFVKTLAPAN